MTPKAPDPRSAAFVLVGATLPILLSLVLKSWVSGSRLGAEAGIGLTGIEVCAAGVCRDVAWAAWKLDGDVSTMAVLSLILGIVALLVAATYGGLALKGLAHKLPPARYAVIVFAVTGFVMVYFSIRLITESPGGLGPGAGMIFGLLGVIGAAIGMRRLGAVTLAPVAAASVATPATPATPACPRCQSPLTFVAQYQRSFCERCRQYA